MYAKLFVQIYDGTLCTKGPWEALVTFQQFLVLADPEGHVDMTAEAIARRTTIPLDIIERGIACLVNPDPDSRSPAEEGRRLIPISPTRDWGWIVVNYKHYRNMKREEDRREYHRAYWHKRKTQQLNQNSTASTESTYAVSSKQEAVSNKVQEHVGIAPKNGAHHAKVDLTPVIQTLPLRDGTDFEVRQSFVAELEPLYPSVDVPRTVGEMKGWLLGNREKRKTRRGIKAFVTRWLQNEQQKAEAH